MSFECPHCHNAVETVGPASANTIVCPVCRNSFSPNAQSGETVGYQEPPPNRIGNYELISEIGRGSFGVVWRGRNVILENFVAIKVPRPDRLDPAHFARFIDEATAAAQLQHEHIVRVYEIGSDGKRAFIVSELIRGKTLDVWRGSKTLPPIMAARLGIRMAEALEHAHANGVIHRDLKPRNILITADGEGAPAPHITDFGLAKCEAIFKRRERTGQVLGTWEYMSPEQARAESHLADARSDVYTLGVVLFELLAGGRPFLGQGEMLQKQILEAEPPRLRKLNAEVSRDLESIVLKCLEKDANRRYQSAKELRKDLDRYVKKQPVLARPVGPVGRCWRWVLRNPWRAAALALLALIVVVAPLVFAALKVRDARFYATAAKTESVLNADLRTALDDVAENAFEFANTTADLGATRAALDANAKAIDATRRLLVSQPGDVKRRTSLASMLHNRSNLQKSLGDYGTARASLDESLAYWRQLIRDVPTDRKFRRNLASTLHHRGMIDYERGDLATAERQYAEAHEVLTKLESSDPDDAESLRSLAHVYHSRANVHISQGQYERALDLLDEELDRERKLLIQSTAAESAERQFSHGLAMLSRATCYTGLGRIADARKAYESALQRLEFAVDKNPADIGYQSMLGMLRNNRARFLDRIGETNRALEEAKRAVELRQQLVERSPNNVDFVSNLANSQAQLGGMMIDRGQFAEGKKSLQKSVALYESIEDRVKENTDTQARYVEAIANLGTAVLGVGPSTQAERLLTRAVELADELFAKSPQDLGLAVTQALAYGSRAQLRRHKQDFAGALADLDQTREILDRLIQAAPQLIKYRSNRAIVEEELGHLFSAQDNRVNAIEHYRACVDRRRTLAEQHPEIPELRRDVASGLYNLGVELQEDPESRDAAIAALREAEGVQRKLFADVPDNVRYRVDLAGTLDRLADIDLDAKRHAEAIKLFEEAEPLLRKAVEDAPEYEKGRDWLDIHFKSLGRALRESKQSDKAMATALARKDLWPGEKNGLYAAAADLAKCVPVFGSTSDPDGQKKCADLAIDALGDSLAAGFNNFEKLDKDADFDPIRNLPRYKTLVDVTRQLDAARRRGQSAAPDAEQPPPTSTENDA